LPASKACVIAATNTKEGLINNVLYVIILSSALDLVGPTVPKGVVLLADVVPSFLTKLTAPYFIDAVPYQTRILILVALSVCGMLLIALTPETKDGGTIAVKMCGAVLASLSSGLGELSFLGLTHFYGHFALASWGSGTGGAGLVGAGAYVLATTTIGLSVRTSLLTFACLPALMVISFFGILPLEPLRMMKLKSGGYESLTQHEEEERLVPDHEDPTLVEHEGLLAASMHSTRSFNAASREATALGKFRINLRRASRLFFP
jgi:battenin